MIKCTDKGPVFYTQQRLTLNGKVFPIYKFRTMVVDAEKKSGPVKAGDKDPRILPVGRFLRATRLDELPQLLNILKGDMSLVGPRPERPELAEIITKNIPEFSYRLKVKAGLTGYAQIYGKYCTTSYDKLKLDLTYIRNYSIWMDLKLILMTPKVLFMKEATEGFENGGFEDPALKRSGSKRRQIKNLQYRGMWAEKRNTVPCGVSGEICRMEKISIIVPVYNCEKYIGTCIESIQGQTYQNLEIILVNDGSKDRSGEICRSYAVHDARIRYIEQENQGVSAARNHGIKKATGTFVMFVDADDTITNDA